MNICKYFLCMLFFIFLLAKGFTQDYRHSLKGIKKVRVEAMPMIIVKNHPRQELLIKAKDNAPNTVAANVDISGNLSNDNTGFGVEVIEKEDYLELRDLRDRRAEDLILYLPPDIDLALKSQSNNDIRVEGFTSEIEASSNQGNIELWEVQGPIVANSNSGDIVIIYKSIDQELPSSIISAAGNIYITLDSTESVSLKLSARVGSIHSEILGKRRGDRRKERANAELIELNGAEVEIRILTSSGDIYIKEKNN